MAYVYGKTKSRAGLAAVTEPAVEVEVIEEPVVEVPDRTKLPNRGRIPGRKRGPGKNNKHGTGCGTNNGYWAHKRAGEDACAPCLKARREFNKAFEQGRRAA